MTKPRSEARALLEAAASSLAHIRILEGVDNLDAAVNVRRRDGQAREFLVRVSFRDGIPVVADLSGTMPGGCPERHINQDGSFCIEWRPEGQREITSAGEASKWWDALYGYLFCQILAEETGKWPKQHQWPHGNAAKVQHEIEQLTPEDKDMLAHVERLKLRAKAGRISDRRQKCPCGSGSRAKDCHEKALVRVALLVQARLDEETTFWAGWKNVTCCRTMHSCPLSGAKT